MVLLQDEAPEFIQYSSFLQIDCDAIAANLAALRRGTQRRLMAVLKNDGYGLSLPGYARLLVRHGVDAFAVGTFEEALKLRRDGIPGDVLLLTPQMAVPVLRALIAERVALTIGSAAQARAALEAAKEAGTVPLAHVMIDTGLGRCGFCAEELAGAADDLRQLDIQGTYTHFSSPYQKPQVTERQYAAFLRAVVAMRAAHLRTGLLHCCASGAALQFPHMHMDMVRCGSALIGRVPQAEEYGLKQAVALLAPITAVRESARCRLGYNGRVRIPRAATVGIVAAGDTCGFQLQRRLLGLLPARQLAEVGGQSARVLGVLGTNSLAIDLTGIGCHEGDMARLGVNPLHCAADLPRLFVRGGEPVAYATCD